MLKMECTGNIINGKADISLSQIFSFLIKEVGTKVKAYQSDLLVDVKSIEKAVENLENTEYYIGLRENGVDGKTFIDVRKKYPEIYDDYICIYKITVKIDEEEADIRVTLTEEEV